MRALRVDRPGRIGIREVPRPTAGGGSVLVRPLLVGLCGTDLEILDGSIDPAYVRYPLTLGHEWVGELADGTRVAVEGIVPCGACRPCHAGRTNLCETYDEIGFTRDGAAAELAVVPGDAIHALPDSVPLESAVLAEPTAVVLQALTRAAAAPGADVLVIGDGTIGLLASAVARLGAPASVHVRGLRAEQEALAAALGADRFLLSSAPPRAYDLVVVAAGAASAVAEALTAVRRGGSVVLLGYAGAGVPVPAGIDDLVNDDVALVGSFAYTRATWRRVMVHLADGTLDAGAIVTHRFGLAAFPDAIAALRSATGRRGKVVLDPTLPPASLT